MPKIGVGYLYLLCICAHLIPLLTTAYCSYILAVLMLGPNELIHIGKGRFHAFRKVDSQPLPKNDCHFALRQKLHTQLQDSQEDIGQLLNVSIAWDWSYLGVTPKGIHEEMAYSLECARQNAERKDPRPSLGIPKLCSFFNAISAHGDTSTSDESKEHAKTVLQGLRPLLANMIELERKSVASQLLTAILTDPDSSQHPQSEFYPFASNGFSCKVCFRELVLTYFRCDGCEKILGQNFDVCAYCYGNNKHLRFHQMHHAYDNRDSGLNHTAKPEPLKCSHKAKKRSKAKYRKVGDHVECCAQCKKCRECACSCHSVFTMRFRFWTIKDLSEFEKQDVEQR
jgi:hypothetical protein